MKKNTFIFSLAIFLISFSQKSFSQAAFSSSLNPTTGCAPVTVNFTDLSTGATSWSWDFDDGSSPSPLQNPSVQYTLPGVYHVTLTINGGSSSVTDTITVYDIPIASFTISDTVVCAGSPVTFTSTSVATGGASIVQYEWGIDGGSDITTVPTITHTFNTPQTYPIVLRVLDSHGCYPSPSAVHTITVIPSPIASFTMSPPVHCGSQPVSVLFSNTSNPAGTNYFWDFGDPASGALNNSTSFNESHTFNTQANYLITLIITDGTCSDTATNTFYWQNMIADFSAVEDTVCFYDTVQFNDLSSPPPATYNWNFGDPGSIYNVDVVPNPVHVFSAPGTYTVTLDVSAGGCADTKTMQIYVRPQPTINFTANDTTFCSPATVVFTPTSTPGVGTAFFDFENPSNDTSSLVPHSHHYNNGVYSVLMVVTDIYGCKDTLLKSNYIMVIPPTANFSPFSPDSGCVPLTINFDGISSTSPADPIVSYHWDFGDGDTAFSTSSTTSHTYTTTGIWDVTLTITTASGCTSTITRPGWERAGLTPTADFYWTPPSPICFGDTIHFHDTSTIALPEHVTGWKWDFGDGGSSLLPNPDHKYDLDSGLYTVTLIAYDNGCPDTIIKDTIINVHPPKPDFQSQTNCATPLTVAFSSTSHGADSLVWDWADGTPKDTINNAIPTHTYAMRGDYWVKLTAFNYQYNCQYTDSHLVQVRIPIAVLQANDTVACYVAFIQFVSASSQDAAGVAWDFGDPASGALNSTSATNPVHQYNLPGDYTVTLIVTDMYGCTSTTTKLIKIQGPVPGFMVNNTTGCTPLAVQFTDTTHFNGSPVDHYHWSFNFPTNSDSLDTTASNFTHVFSVTNHYDIQLTVTDTNGCVASVVYSNFINATFPNPTLVALDTFLCPGSSNTFAISDSSSFVQTFPLYTITWNFGDGTGDSTVQNDFHVDHTYSNNGLYPLTVTVTDSNNCTKTVTQNITVLRPSAAFDTISDLQCGFSRIYLNATGVNDYITNYHYTIYGPYPNLVFDQSSASPADTVFLPYAGNYYAVLTVTNPGCSVTDTVNPLVIAPGPSGYFNFNPDTGCSPLTVVFHVNPGTNSTYIEVNFADGNVVRYPITDTIITHTYHGNNGTHWDPSVILGTSTNTALDCRANAPNLNDSLAGYSQLVTIINPFTNTVTVDTILIKEGESDTLTSVPGYDPLLTYSWTVMPSGDPLTLLNPPSSAVYTANEGDQQILFTVTDTNGCQAYDNVIVILHACEKDIVIPNVFTPSSDGKGGDGKNDTYYIKDLCPIEDFKIIIFNRWGNIVYTSTDYAFHWDGVDDNGRDCSEGVYYYTLHAKRSDLHGYIHLIRGK